MDLYNFITWGLIIAVGVIIWEIENLKRLIIAETQLVYDKLKDIEKTTDHIRHEIDELGRK